MIDRNAMETACSGCGRHPQQPSRCRPPLCASKFSFLHLAVIEEDWAYDSKGSIARRGQRRWLAAKLSSLAA